MGYKDSYACFTSDKKKQGYTYNPKIVLEMLIS